MNPEKDYYAILGLLPSAEAFLVRAAYKALSQKYHPDMSSGDASRMQEINEAYRILSDPSKRTQYDSARSERYRDSPAPNDFDSGQDPEPDSLSSDWTTAVRFYPDLEEITKRLRKFSWRLSSSYQALLIETKNFRNRSEIGERLEDDFLKLYFGSDEDVIEFARTLILSGNRAAAKELNNAVRVIGSSDSDRIISTVKQIHGLTRARARQLKDLVETRRATYKDFGELIELHGGSIESHGFTSSEYTITFKGSKHVVEGHWGLVNWINENIIVET